MIAAEQRIGELLLAIPKQSGGVNQYNKEEKSTRSEKSKTETVKEMGYTKDEASDYQQMARHPAVVQKVIDEELKRQLLAYERAALALKLKPMIAEKAKENLHQGNEPLQKSVNPVNTQKKLAQIAGVSHDTIHKVEAIENSKRPHEAACPERLRMIY